MFVERAVEAGVEGVLRLDLVLEPAVLDVVLAGHRRALEPLLEVAELLLDELRRLLLRRARARDALLVGLRARG